MRSEQQKIPNKAEWDFKSISETESISCCLWELCRESLAARELARLLRRANRNSEKFFRSLKKKQLRLSGLALEYVCIWSSEYFPRVPWGNLPTEDKQIVAKHFREPEGCRLASFHELEQYSKYGTWRLKHGWSKFKLLMSEADAKVPRGRYVTFFIPRLAGREAFERAAKEFTKSIPKRPKSRTQTALFGSNHESLLTGITLIRLKGAENERTWKEVGEIAKSNHIWASDRHITRLVNGVRTVLHRLDTGLALKPIDNEAVNPAEESFDPDEMWPLM